GVVREADLLRGQSFRNAYERSKGEAELLVQDWIREYRGIVFRPSILVGDTRTGIALAFHGLYKLAWAFCLLRERLATRTRNGGGASAHRPLRLPITLPCASKDTPINVVGVEYVIALMVDLYLRPEALGRTFHLTNPSPPTLHTLVHLTARLMKLR